MRDLLFEQKVCYKSGLSAKEIEDKLSALVKSNDKAGDRFAGKVYPSKFSLTPILGSRQNFKVTMMGEVKGDGNTMVEITYAVSSVLKVVVYGAFIGYLCFSLLLKLIGINLAMNGIEHADYYIVATAAAMLVISKLTFISQCSYYSEFISKLLRLKEDEE